MKYIIMCGGKYDDWGIPRQMYNVNGELIAGRTIRLLKDACVTDIAISSNDKRFLFFNVPLLEHQNTMEAHAGKVEHGSWAECFYPLDEPACYIMGDVVFSPAAIRTIVNTETDSIQFFASSPPFPRNGYIKPYAEPFAFKVKDQKRFRAAIDFVNANINTGIFGRHPISWELWQVINGWNVKEINYGSYTAINDYTCDVDRKEDAEKIEKVMKEWE